MRQNRGSANNYKVIMKVSVAFGGLFVAVAMALPGLANSQQWHVPEPQEFDQTKVCLGSMQQPLSVELADKPAQHARGLMGRTSLDDYQGMLFRYQNLRPGNSGFWMYQTLIPLDIAYLNSQGEILKTFTMMPCGSDNPRQCRSYAPGKNYQFALEMKAGFFADHNIRLGDKLTVVGQLEAGQDCHSVAK